MTTSEKRAVIKLPVIKSIRAATRLAKTCKVSLSSLNYKEQRRRKIANVMIRQTVKKFYYRDDVSSCLPGKKDYVKVGKINKQKRVMNDTLGNLHAKFRIENPTVSISCATFKRLRHPKMELYVKRHPVFAVNASQINDQHVIGSMYPYAVPHLRSQKHSQHLKR